MSRRSLWLLLAGACSLLTPLSLAAERQIDEVEVMVGERAVRALCTDGPRRVILLHDEKQTAESWRPVLQSLGARGVGACAYERPAPTADGPRAVRGWFELLDELRRIHAALGAEPRYTLVGHAMGGLYARLFAADRPSDVGGLVLIEPVHEDMPSEARAGVPDGVWSAWTARRRRPNSDGVREVDLARHARGSRLPDIPVTVITATERQGGPGWNVRFVAEAARRVHESVLRGVRVGRHIPAQGSGPRVHIEDPALVAREIADMVRSTTWNGR